MIAQLNHANYTAIKQDDINKISDPHVRDEVLRLSNEAEQLSNNDGLKGDAKHHQNEKSNIKKRS